MLCLILVNETCSVWSCDVENEFAATGILFVAFPAIDSWEFFDVYGTCFDQQLSGTTMPCMLEVTSATPCIALASIPCRNVRDPTAFHGPLFGTGGQL